MNQSIEVAMHRFSVILTYDADDACWYANVPAFGAITDGDSIEEAIAHAREVIEGNVAVYRDKGWEIPSESEPARVEVIELAAV